jgi:hypothetical protein
MLDRAAEWVNQHNVERAAAQAGLVAENQRLRKEEVRFNRQLGKFRRLRAGFKCIKGKHPKVWKTVGGDLQPGDLETTDDEDDQPAPPSSPQIHRQWTAEEDDKLRTLCDQGLTWGQIVEQVPGRNFDSVKKRGRQLGLRTGPRPWTEDDLDTLQEGVERDEPWKAIAGQLKRKEGAVRMMAERKGFKRPDPKSCIRWTAGEDDVIRSSADGGLQPCQIADQMTGRTRRQSRI